MLGRFILFFALFAHSLFAGFDYSALLNPNTYRNVDTTYYSPQNAKAVADIAFDSMGIESRAKVMGVSVPQTLVIKNLRMTVYLPNVSDFELSNIKTAPPFSIVAEKVYLKLIGKKSVLAFNADTAALNSDMSISLAGKVYITLNGKRADYPKGARLSVVGRTLFVRGSGKDFGVRF